MDVDARMCSCCGCRLAADNFGALCTPCDRSMRYRADPIGDVAVGLRQLCDRWRDGFEAFRDAAGLDDDGAATLAVHLGLVHGRLLSASRLAEMARSRRVPTTELARRWGVSRWTVAAWRADLGLDRRATPESVVPPTPPPVVDTVEVWTGDRTRVVTATGAVRLGHSARMLVELLAAHHPDDVPDDLARRAMFPDAELERSRDALHATVSRLRRHLPEETIVRSGSGYRLNVGPEALRRFPAQTSAPSVDVERMTAVDGNGASVGTRPREPHGDRRGENVEMSDT